jgi:hypothetical protein
MSVAATGRQKVARKSAPDTIISTELNRGFGSKPNLSPTTRWSSKGTRPHVSEWISPIRDTADDVAAKGPEDCESYICRVG